MSLTILNAFSSNVSVSYLRAGGRCPPVHLLVPGLSPSQAFLFLEARIWVWEDRELRERPSPPGLRVRPLEPPVRCIWRKKLNSSWQKKNIIEKQNNIRVSTYIVSVVWVFDQRFADFNNLFITVFRHYGFFWMASRKSQMHCALKTIDISSSMKFSKKDVLQKIIKEILILDNVFN